MPDNLISLKNIYKSFTQGDNQIMVLENLSIDVNKGEFIAITGPSGSGKTTLLNIVALIDTVDSGSMFLFGNNLQDLNEKSKNLIRKRKFGFVYQSNNLFEDFNALENVAIPRILNGSNKEKAFEESQSILSRFGLMNRITHFPNDLSGGEQQRVAIARAIINKPQVIIADEPTGNLDKENSDNVFNYLMDYVESEKMTLIMATHNIALSSKSKKQINLF
jgi:lipoprotein-releasing system ATP-binding protein